MNHGPRGAIVRLRGVTMIYPDGTTALEPVDLTVTEGEMVGIVGPSGCGKSTLLRIVAGLLPPTTGLVEAPSDSLAVVFQDATLLPWRSTLRNVELLAELGGVPKATRRARAQEAIRLAGLAGFEQHKPRALSGGMKMRAAMARALVIDPSLMLFDEPFGALDAITRQRMGEELLAFTENQARTSLFITHSIGEAVLLCDRVLVMSPQPGRVVEEFVIPLPRPRRTALRYTPEFSELTATIERALMAALCREGQDS